MYAFAASAAGVSLLALAQPSEARIVYKSTNIDITGRYHLDLNHDGITDVTLLRDSHKLSCRGHIVTQVRFFEYPNTGNGVEGLPPTPLRSGARIGLGQAFYANEGFLASSARAGRFPCKHAGAWWNVTDRYLGVEFKSHKKIHYGWVRLTFSAGSAATLTGYAYETIAGKSIIAGKTSRPADEPANQDFSPDDSLTIPIPDTPQPAALGVLALGAQGVPLWRRKESVGVRPE
jgi:hypothetical protein